MTIEQIKAELYDLRGHQCNGRLTLPRDPGDHGCEGCSRYLQLRAERNERLRESDSFQCDIASALGWPDDGKPFVDHIRELKKRAEAAAAVPCLSREEIERRIAAIDNRPLTPKAELAAANVVPSVVILRGILNQKWSTDRKAKAIYAFLVEKMEEKP